MLIVLTMVVDVGEEVGEGEVVIVSAVAALDRLSVLVAINRGTMTAELRRMINRAAIIPIIFRPFFCGTPINIH